MTYFLLFIKIVSYVRLTEHNESETILQDIFAFKLVLLSDIITLCLYYTN